MCAIAKCRRLSHQPLSALHQPGFLEAAVGALHHDSSSSGCTKSEHIVYNQHTTPIMHIMPIMQIKHTLMGGLRVAQGLSRHSPPPPPCTPHCPELVGAWLSWLRLLLHCLLRFLGSGGVAPARGRWKAAVLSLHADEMACRHLPPA